jgi:hypothetical protein
MYKGYRHYQLPLCAAVGISPLLGLDLNQSYLLPLSTLPLPLTFTLLLVLLVLPILLILLILLFLLFLLVLLLLRRRISLDPLIIYAIVPFTPPCRETMSWREVDDIWVEELGESEGEGREKLVVKSPLTSIYVSSAYRCFVGPECARYSLSALAKFQPCMMRRHPRTTPVWWIPTLGEVVS